KPTEGPEPGNHMLLTRFVLSGLSNSPQLQHFLFFTFCLIYTIPITGNLLIFMVTVHPTIRTPMYFFFRILSFLDISTASFVLPRMLINF
ncbi:O1020 protein, partial [Halcyon senegalensis]|nr:O1020 protein [Halcyon senegalensis]